MISYLISAHLFIPGVYRPRQDDAVQKFGKPTRGFNTAELGKGAVPLRTGTIRSAIRGIDYYDDRHQLGGPQLIYLLAVKHRSSTQTREWSFHQSQGDFLSNGV